MVQHPKWDISFLDGGDDEDEDLLEDTLNASVAPTNDASVTPLANDILAPLTVDIP